MNSQPFSGGSASQAQRSPEDAEARPFLNFDEPILTGAYGGA
jgi:hypothetical protein